MADAEIAAMSVIAEALSALGDEERGRVVRWAAERYGVGLTATPIQRQNGQADQGKSVDTEHGQEISVGTPISDSGRFEHFADLYDAYKPTSEVDGALVAGYWFQAILGNASFVAAEINKELKNLGHASGNITTALTGNMVKKPALILQVKKSGSTRQARKTYKLSNEGLKQVLAKIG